MNDNIILTEDEKDCLQELMNVAYGSATAAITEILNAYAKLSIPKIQIINASEFKDYLTAELNLDEKHLIALQEINGAFNGENMFVIDEKSAINMAYPGLKNAKHKEVKELVANIISAQSKEIGMMQQWQSQWGYVKASE